MTRGLIHEYLDKLIEFSNTYKAMLTMYEYIQSTLEELPEERLSGGAETPAANYLFSVDPYSEKLVEKDAIFFHHNVAKLLFLSKRVRLEIQPTVIFLCKRVREPDMDDTKKLI